MLRLKYMIIEVYKCIKGLNPDYMNKMFSIKDVTYDFRDNSIAIQHKFSTTTFGRRSFSYYGSKLWNSLPRNLKKTEPEIDFSKLPSQTADAIKRKRLFRFKIDLHNWLFESKPEHLLIF